MADNKTVFKAANFKKENFLNVINPDQQIVQSQGFLSFNTGIYGTKIDNAFPDFLIDLYLNSSSAHQNLINWKSQLILGNNLQAEDDTQEALVNEFIAKRNKAGENLKQVYAKCTKDMGLSNSVVLQTVFSRDGKIAETYHVPFQNFRLGKANKYGQIEWGYINNKWGQISNSMEQKSNNSDAVKIRMFDPSDYKKHPVQLMYIRDYSYSYYAMPSYSAALNWLLIQREISDFHLNNIRSNFFLAGMLIQKKGGMSDTEIQSNESAVEKFFMGGQGRKILEAYVDDMTNDAPKFERFSPDDQDKLFQWLSQQAFQETVTAHNGYSILAGMDAKGSDLGGDANKLITAIAAFTNFPCNPMKELIVGGINRIMEVNGLPPVQVITELPKITLPTQQPEDTTVNERRSMLFGLPEIDNSANNANTDNKIPTA